MSLQIRIRYLYLYLYEVFNVLFFHHHIVMSGDGENRTLDPLLARQVLSQLSYAPICPCGLSILFPQHFFEMSLGTRIRVHILNQLAKADGLKWTRTTDLTLIRRAL